jgi:2-hydroxy-6-oxonona-2,4-dienedioate hydrolase
MASIMFQSEEARQRMRQASAEFLARFPGPVEERFAATAQGRTRILVTGPADGPPMLVFHGAIASAAHVLPELGPIVNHCRVYAVDVVGQSPWSEDRRLQDPAAWLGEVADALGLEQFALLGASWGGMTALRAALGMPERLRQLVLVVPVGIVSGSAWAGIVDAAWPLMMYRWRPTPARLEPILKTQFTNHDPAWARYLGEALLAYRLDFHVPRFRASDGWENLRCPVLVFGAEHDIHSPGEALLRRIRSWLPHAETELLRGSKHCPPLTPEFRQFLGLRVLRFLNATSEVTARKLEH